MYSTLRVWECTVRGVRVCGAIPPLSPPPGYMVVWFSPRIVGEIWLTSYPCTIIPTLLPSPGLGRHPTHIIKNLCHCYSCLIFITCTQSSNSFIVTYAWYSSCVHNIVLLSLLQLLDIHHMYAIKYFFHCYIIHMLDIHHAYTIKYLCYCYSCLTFLLCTHTQSSCNSVLLQLLDIHHTVCTQSSTSVILQLLDIHPMYAIKL